MLNLNVEHGTFKIPTFALRVDLLELPFDLACDTLRNAMFMDFTRFWKTVNHAAFTRPIPPEWNHRLISMQMFCKRSNTIYHSITCGHSGLRGWRFKINSCANPYCRFGCTVVKDAAHIWLNFPIWSLSNSHCQELY